MLTSKQRRFWEAYERAEDGYDRTEKLRCLEAFLGSLEESSSSEWFPWARSLAEQVIDHSRALKIRRPLFERALFPALLDGYRLRVPGSARWLAGFHQQLLQCDELLAQLPEEDRSEQGLLRTALASDPNDRRTRSRLIDITADYLKYTLHELPAGVLDGANGATPEKCAELLDYLDAFTRLLGPGLAQDQYAELIARCRFHFREYAEYLNNREEYINYSDYLSRQSTTDAGAADP